MSEIATEKFYEYAYELGLSRPELQYVIGVAESVRLLSAEEEVIQEREKELFEEDLVQLDPQAYDGQRVEVYDESHEV
jgi:hypothetical protein